MRRPNFLTADEIALFRSDNDKGGECYIAKGPLKSAAEAFDIAFKGYDYDQCHSVIRMDIASGTFEDVTDIVADDLTDTEDFEFWMENVHPAPLFMADEVNEGQNRQERASQMVRRSLADIYGAPSRL